MNRSFRTPSPRSFRPPYDHQDFHRVPQQSPIRNVHNTHSPHPSPDHFQFKPPYASPGYDFRSPIPYNTPNRYHSPRHNYSSPQFSGSPSPHHSMPNSPLSARGRGQRGRNRSFQVCKALKTLRVCLCSTRMHRQKGESKLAVA